MLFSIDRWGDHHDTLEMDRCRELLAAWGVRSRVIRSTFAEALELFEPASLDFVYVDGYAHEGQERGRTLRDWWPKLRPGGLFAGHDYHSDWQATVDMVDRFMAMEGLDFRVTGEERWPSWYTVKPEASGK